jgi:hypothetical protein
VHIVEPLDAEGEKILSRKLQWHVLFIVCFINLMLFVSLFSTFNENQSGTK